jgi:TPP-dependent indolepyruvate ferredoxin oxidoreductase alpha subunit
MDKISSSQSPVKKGQLRRTGRYFCINALLVGIQTYKMALVYYNKPANAKKHPQQESIDMIRKIIHIDEEKCNGCGLCPLP